MVTLTYCLDSWLFCECKRIYIITFREAINYIYVRWQQKSCILRSL